MLGQLDLARPADEERQAELFLEQLDMPTDGPLADMELGRGVRTKLWWRAAASKARKALRDGRRIAAEP
jgi:hypothetical protein